MTELQKSEVAREIQETLDNIDSCLLAYKDDVRVIDIWYDKKEASMRALRALDSQVLYLKDQLEILGELTQKL